MTFAFFLSDLISSGQSWIAVVMSWLAELRNSGEAFGLILLLAMTVAVTVALWWSVYQTLLVWLRDRPEFLSRRR